MAHAVPPELRRQLLERLAAVEDLRRMFQPATRENLPPALAALVAAGAVEEPPAAEAGLRAKVLPLRCNPTE